MATNLHIDEMLLAEAKALGKHRTKRETVDEALHQYIARLKRLGSLGDHDSLDFDPAYDYKRARQAR